MKVVAINPYKKTVSNNHLFVSAADIDDLICSPLCHVWTIRDNEYLVADARVSTRCTFNMAGIPFPVQGMALIVGTADGLLTDTMFHADYIRPSVEFTP